MFQPVTAYSDLNRSIDVNNTDTTHWPVMSLQRLKQLASFRTTFKGCTSL